MRERPKISLTVPSTTWWAAVALLLVCVLAGSGCDTAQEPAVSADPVYTAASPPPFLRSAPEAGKGAGDGDEWYLLASAEVKARESKTVGGGRYELSFPRNALGSTTVVTISEHDSHIIDFELGPDGLQFNRPVTLRIDYSGTNADPSCSLYDGSTPVLYWYNPGADVWEEIPGHDDLSQKKYYATLSHFSRYALGGGRAGWGR